MYIKILKEMFQEMVLKKDAEKISYYYHRDFLLFTNGQTTDYKTFLEDHRKYYKTALKYLVEYDETTLLEQEEKVAGRIWITTKRPEEPEKKIEVILIAQFKDKKIYRLWELTYPNWMELAAFKEK